MGASVSVRFSKRVALLRAIGRNAGIRLPPENRARAPARRATRELRRTLGAATRAERGGVDNSGHFVDWVEYDGRWLGAKMTREWARTRLLQASRPPGQWERVWIASRRALIG